MLICYRIRTLISFSCLAIPVGTFSYITLSLFVTLDVQAVNIVIGTAYTTIGTEDDDVMVGCSYLVPQCSQ